MDKFFDVIGIGVSTVDFINVVEKFSVSEDVQKTKMMKMDCGGPVSTAIVSLARLGARTAMVDNIGDDLAGQYIISEYLKEKVDTTHISIAKNCASSVSSVIVRESDGSRIIYYSPSTAEELTHQEIDTELLSKTKIIHTNGRHLDAAISAAAFARDNGIKVSFDGGSNRYRPELIPLIHLSDICIVTRQFAETFSNEKDINRAAEFISASGPKLVVITEGISGSRMYTKNIKGYHQKAFTPNKVVDTTGCGDCYHGAFLFGLVQNWDLIKIIEFASAAAALNVRGLGGRTALPVKSEVLELIKQNTN